MKYAQFRMWLEAQKHPEIRRFLKDRFGLVPPKPECETGFGNSTVSAFSEEEKLVYEEDGRGIYRVDFFPDNEHGSHVWFRYWDSQVSPEINSRDPMLEAIVAIYDKYHPTKCNKSPFTDGMEILGRP